MNWNEASRRILAELEGRIDSIVRPMREISHPIVVPYRGYGTSRSVWLCGRVIDDPGLDPSGQGSTAILGHPQEMWRRFASQEIAGARVEITVGSTITETETDAEGYFDLEIPLDTELERDRMWHPYRVRLIEPAPREDDTFEGTVLVPPETTTLGIISDIDDTVIDSYATDLLEMIRTLLFTETAERLPFEGVQDLLEALIRSDDQKNPVFYVSSSPWNLYDFLVELMEVHALPKGPLLLQDFGLDETKLLHSPHDEHKLARISRVIGTYPGLEWILIGDSGQRDPEIYRAVTDEVSDRIKAIIIRDVTTQQRDDEVKRILEPLEGAGLPVALVRTAGDARTRLEDAGLLHPRAGEMLG